MIVKPSSAEEGVRQVADYLAASSSDGDLRDKLVIAVSQASSVSGLMRAIETIYAEPAKDDTLRSLLVGLTLLACEWGFEGVRVNNRGAGIIKAMLRELGEEPPIGVAWPDPGEDPLPEGALPHGLDALTPDI